MIDPFGPSDPQKGFKPDPPFKQEDFGEDVESEEWDFTVAKNGKSSSSDSVETRDEKRQMVPPYPSDKKEQMNNKYKDQHFPNEDEPSEFPF
ncbi:hypothetical protein KGF56_003781 [Candida oxycetoniae]|uniref:Uncharacterized protein n=1 Tax=Candida oxycetoniae TaxID=497107 RepID=A0AAI9SV45_9ASCO|nr:uncharacterized protein KGF56_003781 [Candida oxycetoniae]KAI3403497.1 hypothetical protein KGF56_003781 [Candida oxycetoniae]